MAAASDADQGGSTPPAAAAAHSRAPIVWAFMIGVLLTLVIAWIVVVLKRKQRHASA